MKKSVTQHAISCRTSGASSGKEKVAMFFGIGELFGTEMFVPSGFMGNKQHVFLLFHFCMINNCTVLMFLEEVHLSHSDNFISLVYCGGTQASVMKLVNDNNLKNGRHNTFQYVFTINQEYAPDVCIFVVYTCRSM